MADVSAVYRKLHTYPNPTSPTHAGAVLMNGKGIYEGFVHVSIDMNALQVKNFYNF
jgi:hypothetical protein